MVAMEKHGHKPSPLLALKKYKVYPLRCERFYLRYLKNVKPL